MPLTGFNMPVAATTGTGSTGGISVAKMIDEGNAPRRTNKAAERRDSRPTIVQNIQASPGMSEELVGQYTARELMFRYEYE